MAQLVIPNREIQWIFIRQIREWFEAETRRDRRKLESFCRAFEENDTAAIEESNLMLRQATAAATSP